MKAKIANLPSGVNVHQISSGSKDYWRVRLGKRFTGGAEVKKNFKTLADAREWIFGDAKEERVQTGSVIDLQKAAGSAAFSLTPSQLAEAAAAFKKLKNHSLTAAVDYFIRNANPDGGQRTVSEVVKEFIKSRKAMGVKRRTLTQYESYLRTIEEKFGQESVSTLKRAKIEDWIADSHWAKRTRNNYVSTLSTLLLFAKGRGYCLENPAESVPRAILDDEAPGILTVPQVCLLLERAMEECPEIVAYIAISLFAGLRRSEVCALEWSEIDLDGGHIEVKSGKAKTRQRRIVDISQNLAAWLKVCQRGAHVAPSTNEDVTGELLRRLVEERKNPLGKIEQTAVVAPWPHNALRHSFGSYHFAANGDENRTAAQMGNSPAVIFRHYRAVVKPAEAALYWKVLPPI